MLRKKSHFMLSILLLAFCAYALAESPIIPPSVDNKTTEKPIRAEPVLKIGSDKANEDFYMPPLFAMGKDGQIFILDTGNSRIQCFSREGGFLFSFGRLGQGPAELSNGAGKIKILPDGNIYVIDNPQRRINVYNQEGQFLYFKKTSAWYNDIVLLNNTYYLSNIILEEKHKPIHVSRSLGKIDADFGIFIEPAIDLLKQISQLIMPQPWRVYFNSSNFTKLTATHKNELIFSQGFPYRLIKYDTKGNVLKDIVGNVDFDSSHQVKINSNIKEGWVGMMTYPPGADSGTLILLDVCIRDDNQVVVPYLNPEKSMIYMDFYDLDLNLISRYKLLNTFVDIKNGDYISQIMLDNDDHLYAMTIHKEDYPQLVKYKLKFV